MRGRKGSSRGSFLREAGEECGSQRNCRQSMNLILVCTHSKELLSFAGLCPCTSVPNSGAVSINCPMSWVALYIMHNASFFFVRESESRRHTYIRIYRDGTKIRFLWDPITWEVNRKKCVLASEEKTAEIIKGREGVLSCRERDSILY